MILLNELICFLNVVRLERRLTNKHGVEDYAERPHVHLVRMAFPSLEDLWSYIIRSAAYSSFPLALELELSCETEVPDFDFHARAEEQVA